MAHTIVVEIVVEIVVGAGGKLNQTAIAGDIHVGNWRSQNPLGRMIVNFTRLRLRHSALGNGKQKTKEGEFCISNADY